ncbi:MAG: hypothetical protein CSA62_03805 [Planctomycetota bacterium]|nr:MAG: hypothetical protein CSA62_03805 [Planctomycetota bacterium]
MQSSRAVAWALLEEPRLRLATGELGLGGPPVSSEENAESALPESSAVLPFQEEAELAELESEQGFVEPEPVGLPEAEAEAVQPEPLPFSCSEAVPVVDRRLRQSREAAAWTRVRRELGLGPARSRKPLLAVPFELSAECERWDIDEVQLQVQSDREEPAQSEGEEMDFVSWEIETQESASLGSPSALARSAGNPRPLPVAEPLPPREPQPLNKDALVQEDAAPSAEKPSLLDLLAQEPLQLSEGPPAPARLSLPNSEAPVEAEEEAVAESVAEAELGAEQLKEVEAAAEAELGQDLEPSPEAKPKAEQNVEALLVAEEEAEPKVLVEAEPSSEAEAETEIFELADEWMLPEEPKPAAPKPAAPKKPIPGAKPKAPEPAPAPAVSRKRRSDTLQVILAIAGLLLLVGVLTGLYLLGQ